VILGVALVHLLAVNPVNIHVSPQKVEEILKLLWFRKINILLGNVNTNVMRWRDHPAVHSVIIGFSFGILTQQDVGTEYASSYPTTPP
jgi:hypothetical protein